MRSGRGIPLALELAAARVPVLAPEQIAERMDDALRLLAVGNRGAPMRQQTLRATLDWSHDLLAPPERVLPRRLSVFSGGCTLEAVEATCSDHGRSGRAGAGTDPAVGLGLPDVLDALGRLVDKSLVIADPAPGAGGGPAPRYRLLEPVRQYARERLVASGEAAALRARHAAFYLALTESAAPTLLGPEQSAWLDRLEGEHDNLRAALTWSLAGGRAPSRPASGDPSPVGPGRATPRRMTPRRG